MRIASIATSRHRLPLDPPFHAAWDPRPRTFFDVTLVRVRTDEGLEGVGAGDPMPGFEGHEDLFVGQDPLDLERHARILDNLSFHYGRCWPLDLALWDLAGKIQGAPCWRLLGSTEPRLRLYASTGTVLGSEATADQAERLLEDGFAAMKLRLCGERHRDLARIEAVRARTGARLALMVDANQAWRMPWDASPPARLEDALALARALEDLGVHWLEEPLHRADYDGMRTLRWATRLRIAGGEMARELHDLRELILRGCVDVIQPDVALIGGITGLRAIARLAKSHGVTFTPHTWGNGVGLMANAQLAAGMGASPWLEWPYDPPSWTPARRDFPLASPLRADADGHLALPDAPGLGLELDEARLAETRIG